MAKKTRIQIDVSDEVLDQLQALKVTSGSTNASVFRNALKLYKLAREEESKGGRIIIEGKKGDKKQVIIP